MSSLHLELEEHLAVRRAMGFKMERHEKLLAQFTGFLARNGETAVTTENALAWATLPAAARPRWHALRLSAVRGFASWLNAADPARQVPPRRLIPYGSRGIVPSLYSDHEIMALAREAGRLSGRLRAATFGTLIRLLAVTGMRVENKLHWAATSPTRKTDPWSGPGTRPASWRHCAAWRSACCGWTATPTSPPPTATTPATRSARSGCFRPHE